MGADISLLFTSGETRNARKLRQVAGTAVANGLPYEVAIAAMTSLAAEIFGGKFDPMTSRQTALLKRYLPTEGGLGRAYINP